MTLWKADDGCTQDVYMGKKRDRLCEHGRLFEKVREDGAPPSRRRSTLNPGRGFAASPAQREKVKHLVCVGCGKDASEYVAIDPAHLWPRGKGGCDDRLCVLPLCRLVFDGSGCHRLFDEGKLDLLPRLIGSEAWSAEMAHPISAHGVNPKALVERLTGAKYVLLDHPRNQEVASAASSNERTN